MFWRQKIAFAALAIAAFTTFSSAANALVFDFTFTQIGGSGTPGAVSGSGEFITGPTGSPYTITGISGTVFDSDVFAGAATITGLSPYAAATNVLYFPGPPFVDFGGISFSTSAGIDFNLYNDGSGPNAHWVLSSTNSPNGYPDGQYAVSLQVTAVPEASTWAMMILGFMGVGFIAYRRKSSSTALRIA